MKKTQNKKIFNFQVYNPRTTFFWLFKTPPRNMLKSFILEFCPQTFLDFFEIIEG